MSRFLGLGWFGLVGRAQWFPLCGFSRVSCVDTDCCFYRPFLGAVHGGTVGCSSLTSWRVRGCVSRCCFCIVFDSAGSAGVVFGPTLVVVVLFELIAYLTGLNSNPSGSSDPWVAVRPSGVPGGGPGGRRNNQIRSTLLEDQIDTSDFLVLR
ncbi:hypothetical protein Taro_056640 [Colocasia esculenta]|uniref:Secreted protein n=1 Tax=Colocasia esculenta TaxID=4460 RepID=A0A843XUF7_COLES|nr:hypothetical protein [Colocasia esculenta]